MSAPINPASPEAILQSSLIVSWIKATADMVAVSVIHMDNPTMEEEIVILQMDY